MRNAFAFIFIFFASTAFGQAQQSGQPETKTVEYKEEFVLNADSTGLVVRVQKVEETAINDDMSAALVRQIDEQIKQFEANIESLKTRRKEILSINALITFRKNKTKDKARK